MQRTLRRARRRVGATAFTLAATASLALTTATAPASAATPVLPNPGSVIGDPWELQTVMRAAAAVVDHSAPGMSIAIVKPDPHQPGESITTTYYFGLADKENKHKVGPQTQFEIASETKTFTGALLAKRIYRGLAELDDPAQDYEQNVTFPTMDGSAITLGDLVTHRSGLTDDPGNLHAGCPGDDPKCVDAKALYNRTLLWEGLEAPGTLANPPGSTQMGMAWQLYPAQKGIAYPYAFKDGASNGSTSATYLLPSAGWGVTVLANGKNVLPDDQENPTTDLAALELMRELAPAGPLAEGSSSGSLSFGSLGS
ncbi:serine hydrolase domain-containing protein [Rhodococcus sp. TAF43]|uniref:serine hydrolase domain-containing protein n=1 Tax=unclassified Rhodococcus (in: high G+C Gram-positive bacteria) TaxID=192944 RepID=UPI001582F760|nr:serine hydrolase domain-containing protein [Rhodococcus sp. W8901]QKT12207.1 beta-lactamase family protein [Rhodococcus sp. W8901]